MSSARDDWYYLKEGESDQIGPVSFQEICILYKTNKIEADDLIAQRGMSFVEAGFFLEEKVIEAAISEDEWFILSSDETHGPYTFSQLQNLFANKEISEATLIGRSGAKGIPARDLILACPHFLYQLL